MLSLFFFFWFKLQIYLLTILEAKVQDQGDSRISFIRSMLSWLADDCPLSAYLHSFPSATQVSLAIPDTLKFGPTLNISV